MTDSASDQDPLGPLADEFLERQRRGERPDASEYTRRYPERADEIRALLSALLVLEDVRPGPPAGAAWASSTRRCRSRWAGTSR